MGRGPTRPGGRRRRPARRVQLPGDLRLGARRAGLEPPRRFRVGGWTDPALALFAGLPTVSVLSMEDGVLANQHSPADTPERVDWGSVERCLRLATGIGETWAGEPTPGGVGSGR